jgi:hypothetical protein
MATVDAAGVAHENRLLLNCMTALTVGGAWIDGVSVVEASADRKTFDDLVTHVEKYPKTTRVVD